ncbi:MAG: patatin-like phospholipase family protein [Spirochaetales bacterium]|nr:patatin-like phospholipase family protein [Spirochaetales bacterium]
MEVVTRKNCPVAEKISKRKRALILSGGGARGAYQVGVWKFLRELDWEPDLVCGTSVGAVNATGIGCGLNVDELIQLWRAIHRGKIYRISMLRQIYNFFTRRSFTAIMDTHPLKNFLLERYNLENLRKSRTEIIVTAVNILNSQLKFFNNKVIDIEHVMASAAIPILFPWQYIDGEPYWDGGVMANTPLLPALERGAREIIVVLLSPVGGQRLKLPRNRKEAIERVFEQSLVGSYESFMAHLAFEYKQREQQSLMEKLLRKTLTLGDIRIATVAPDRMLGFYSILNFSHKQADLLIQEGYMDARNQLSEFFGRTEPY